MLYFEVSSYIGSVFKNWVYTNFLFYKAKEMQKHYSFAVIVIISYSYKSKLILDNKYVKNSRVSIKSVHNCCFALLLCL